MVAHPRFSAEKPLLTDLALQGGGSHGAFSWGVIDRLLEEEWVRLDGISGTSAGAMNAAVLAYGLLDGGRAGAKKALEDFWKRVSDGARFSPFQRTPLDMLLGRWDLDHSPMYLAAEMMSRMVSPYAMPNTVNPLVAILEDTIDFKRLPQSPIRLFITATNVRTGRGRVFRNKDLTTQALLASACLPTMFQAVEIDGEPYWDGGYSGNPTLTPLVRECDPGDLVIVPINPVERPGTPTSARDILNRLNEVSFNSSLLKELRMIALLRQALPQGSEAQLTGDAARWAQMRVHVVPNEVVVELGYSSKLNAEWAFLTMLRDEGRAAAQRFLDGPAKRLGLESTLPFDMLALEA
jgi:NTE family protein